MIRFAFAVAAAAFAAAQPARAQPAAAPAPRIGVMADPCAAVEPLPAEVTAYMAAVAQARAAKQPEPPPTAAGTAAYNAWSARRLGQEFSGRCRYQAENAKLAPASPARVVFFGDSITEGWSGADPVLFQGDMVNRGISGQTTGQMVGRFRQDVIDLKPKVVHILAGTNDIAGNTGPTSLAWIEDNVRSLVELAKAHRIRVVLSGVLPAARYPWRPEIGSVEPIAALNAWMMAYAAAEGVTYVDYASALTDGAHGIRPEFSRDGVHPNAAGYAAMRPVARRAIDRALAGR